jgi:hypothetical protein
MHIRHTTEQCTVSSAKALNPIRFSYLRSGPQGAQRWRLLIGTSSANPLRIAVSNESKKVALASSAPL